MSIIYRAPENEKEIRMAAELEKACLSTAWSEAQIANRSEFAHYLCAIEDGAVCGIASMYAVAGECQIMNIAVAQNFRRRGIASGLMNALILLAKSKNCEALTLEVAEDNRSATALYEKCGFTAVGRRKGFYNGKDALVMEKIL